MGDDPTLDDEIAQLVANARRTWAAITQEKVRIDYVVRLELPGVRDPITAQRYVDRVINDLKCTASSGIWLYSAVHEEPFLHVHGVIHLSRRLAGQFVTTTEFRDWFRRYWYHGPVWAQGFDETKRHGGGMVGYAARDPGTVVWG